MVSMLTSSVVDGEVGPYRVKAKTIKFVFAASLLGMQHYGVRARTGWVRIKIMCPEWGDMSTCKVLFYRPSTKKKKLSMLV